jgi:hypothetical protein
MKKVLLIVLMAALFAGAAFAEGRSETSFVTIGTGGVTGVYYPTGGAISRMVNAKPEYGVRATVESTGGSVFNINAVLSGDLDFGIAQSDRQFQAYNGLAEWTDLGPQEDLRAVFSIHPESITLVASVDSGINGIADLAGKRVNIGNPGSGNLQNSLDVLAAFGLTEADINAEQVSAVEAPSLLQDGRIDAFFYTVGHPNGNITESTSGRVRVKIVPIEGPQIRALLDEYSYYAASRIPASAYPSAANDTPFVNSVGVKATLVTSADVSDDVVYAITKEVFDNFETFKGLHPAYQVLTPEDMLTGLSAPIHPGALRYYREAGLVDLINPALILN